jgi:release factor glutamine methyltransferase
MGAKGSTRVVALLFLLHGCAQYEQREVVHHPGSYPVIKLGKQQIDGPIFRITQIRDKIFYSYPRILGPTFFSAYLLEHTQIREGETVLDIGTGSGVQAIYAAEKAQFVLATDIDQLALKNTLLNARRHNVAHKIEVRKSDLFDALKADEKFDVIIASIPYAWNEKTQKWWALQERFFNDVGKHLKPEGRIYFLTGLLQNLPRTKEFIERNQLRIVRLDMAYANEHDLEPMVYMIQHRSAVEKKLEEKSGHESTQRKDI